jgi:hypothetical protein
MPNDLGPERRLTLRQADQARTDFAIIEDDLEAIYARLAKIPTRSETLRLALGCVAAVVVAVTDPVNRNPNAFMSAR